jgi:hypothetical protein
MEGTILLSYSEDTHLVEQEEKSKFLQEILMRCFADIPEMMQQVSNIWNNTNILSVDQKIKLRALLNESNIQIIDDMDGRLKIYLDSDLIGSWDKAKYCLRKDLQVKDPKKRIYMEMHIKYWSLFDEEETEQESE